MFLTHNFNSEGVELRAWFLISTFLIKHVFVMLLKDKSKFLFLHLKVIDFRRLSVLLQMS